LLNKIGEPSPPSGFKLKLARAPIYLYRIGLGGLMGDRFLRLRHRGRRTGNSIETVLEVIRHDESTTQFFVASGYGTKSQWYRNIIAEPHVSIMVKNTEHNAVARVVSPDEATQILGLYAAAHPKSIKAVARLSGYNMDGTESDIVEFSSIIKIIEFTVKKS
tara:strand:+ start:1541 stop:2026 length:486 start_codon:yes stop_codon:yes gene_type:complete